MEVNSAAENCTNMFNTSAFLDVYYFYFENAKYLKIIALLTDEHIDPMNLITTRILAVLHTTDTYKKESFTVSRFTLAQSSGRPMKQPSNEEQHFEKEQILVTTVQPSTPKQLRNFGKSRRLSTDVEYAFLILVWDDFILNRFLDEKGEFDRPRGTFIILFLSYYRGSGMCEQWTMSAYKILRRLWRQFGILNAVIGTPCGCTPQDLFIFKPFMRIDGDESRWGKLLKFDANDAKRDPHLHTNNLDDLNGYPIKVVMFPRAPTAVIALPSPMVGDYINKELWRSEGYAGLDGRLLIGLTESMNFKANVSNTADHTEFGYRLANGSFVGSLGDVVNRRTDISFNGRYIKDYGTKSLEFLTPVSNELVCILTPKAQKIPQWIMIFQCFNVTSWIAIAVTVFVAGTFSHFLESYSLHPDSGRTINEYSKTLLNVFGLFISLQVTLSRSESHRIFLATCLVFNVIVAGTFQGTLITSYTTESYYKDVNTLQQLDGSGLRIGTGSNNLRDIFNNETELMKSLGRKMVVLNESTIDRAAEDRNIAAIERKGDAEIFIKTKFVNADGTAMLHIVSECPRAYFVSYIVPRGSPYLRRFNSAIIRYFESGFFGKWYNHITEAYIIESRSKLHIEGKFQKPLGLNAVQTAFYVLILGCVLASAVFAVEYFTPAFLKQLCK